jgi:hypothetical protein
VPSEALARIKAGDSLAQAGADTGAQVSIARTCNVDPTSTHRNLAAGARTLLAQAVEAEVADFLAQACGPQD